MRPSDRGQESHMFRKSERPDAVERVHIIEHIYLSEAGSGRWRESHWAGRGPSRKPKLTCGSRGAEAESHDCSTK